MRRVKRRRISACFWSGLFSTMEAASPGDSWRVWEIILIPLFIVGGGGYSRIPWETRRGWSRRRRLQCGPGGVARGMQRDRHPPNPTRQQERDKDNMFSRTEGLVGRCFSTRGGPIYKVSLGLYHGPEFVPSAAGSTAGTGQGRGGRRWGQKEEAEAVVIDSRPGIIIPCLNSCSLVFVHPFVFPDTTDKAAGQRDEEEEEGGCGGIQG